MNKPSTILFTTITLCASFFSCSKDPIRTTQSNEVSTKTNSSVIAPSTLKVGVIEGPEAKVMEVVVSSAKSKYNMDVQLIRFNDYVSPNSALADGSIDLNAFQHQPYLDETVKAKGYKLKVIANTFLYPMGFYSKKYKSLDALPNKAKIAIPNDPSNEGRALSILQKHNLIKLKEGVGRLASVRDIIENKKQLSISTLDAAQLPRALQDVDLAAINTNFAVPAGLNPKTNALIVEDTDSPYMNLIVSREGDESRPVIQNFIRAYQSRETIAKADEVFSGAALAGFEIK